MNLLYGGIKCVAVWQMDTGVSETISGFIFKAGEFLYGFRKILRISSTHTHRSASLLVFYLHALQLKPLTL